MCLSGNVAPPTRWLVCKPESGAGRVSVPGVAFSAPLDSHFSGTSLCIGWGLSVFMCPCKRGFPPCFGHQHLPPPAVVFCYLLLHAYWPLGQGQKRNGRVLRCPDPSSVLGRCCILGWQPFPGLMIIFLPLPEE